MKDTSAHHQEALRHGRHSEPGYCYLVTSVTNERQPFLQSRAASEIVLNALRWLEHEHRIRLVVAVVMPDHVHFIAQLEQASLSKVMHSLKSYTANEINKLLSQTGAVWEPQYHETAIRSERALEARARYCLENPVRKGFVNDFREYPFWYCAYDV